MGNGTIFAVNIRKKNISFVKIKLILRAESRQTTTKNLGVKSSRASSTFPISIELTLIWNYLALLSWNPIFVERTDNVEIHWDVLNYFHAHFNSWA